MTSTATDSITEDNIVKTHEGHRVLSSVTRACEPVRVEPSPQR